MSYGLYAVVIFVTFMCAILGVSLALEKADRKFERLTLLAQLDQATANVQLPHAGRLGYQGAQDPAFEIDPMHLHQDVRNGSKNQPEPDPMVLAAAAYQLGQERARSDDTARENEILWMIAEYDDQQRKRDRQ